MKTLYRPLKEGEVIKLGDVFFRDGNPIQVFRPAQVPSFDEVKKIAQISSNDDVLDCEECQIKIYKATLRFLGLEEK